MNTLFTSSTLVVIALTMLTATPSVQAQQTRQAILTGRKPVAVRTTSARPAPQVVRPSTTATPQTAPAVAVTNQEPATSAAAKPAPATAPARPQTSVLTATVQPATTRSTTKQKYLNAGIGLAAYYGGGLPLGVSFEVDTKNNISVGGSVDYFRYGYNSGGYKWNYTFVYVGARASYHLGELLNVADNKFDPYVGATLGLRYAGYHDTYGYDNYVSPYNSGLFLGIHLGSRYMFSEKVGGFAEVGYGVSALRLGVAAKF